MDSADCLFDTLDELFKGLRAGEFTDIAETTRTHIILERVGHGIRMGQSGHVQVVDLQGRILSRLDLNAGEFWTPSGQGIRLLRATAAGRLPEVLLWN